MTQVSVYFSQRYSGGHNLLGYYKVLFIVQGAMGEVLECWIPVVDFVPCAELYFQQLGRLERVIKITYFNVHETTRDRYQ